MIFLKKMTLTSGQRMVCARGKGGSGRPLRSCRGGPGETVAAAGEGHPSKKTSVTVRVLILPTKAVWAPFPASSKHLN